MARILRIPVDPATCHVMTRTSMRLLSLRFHVNTYFNELAFYVGERTCYRTMYIRKEVSLTHNGTLKLPTRSFGHKVVCVECYTADDGDVVAINGIYERVDKKYKFRSIGYQPLIIIIGNNSRLFSSLVLANSLAIDFCCTNNIPTYV